MQRPWTSLKYLLPWNRPGRTIVRCRPWTRLFLERLEDRITPTIAFQPYFGSEATTFGDGEKLNNTPVELIFWGSTYWNNPSGASASQVASAYSALLSSPYYNHLSQYGAGRGTNYLAGSWIDNVDSDPGSTVTDTDIQNEIVHAINDPNSPIDPPSNFTSTPLYVVVTPRGTTVSTESGDAGYHSDFNANTNYGSYNLIYAWTGNFTFGGLQGTMTNLDSLTDIFSHETSEAMTDAQPFSGITCSPGSNLPGVGTFDYGEIGDFEPEDFNLDAYRVDGILAQATWDFNDGAFVVSDGNTQTFWLYPQYSYNGSSYTFTGNILYVNGDQYGYGSNDNITLFTTAAGGVGVSMNGEAAEFDPGLDITTVNIVPWAGSNTVNVLSTPAGTATNIYDEENGNNTVTIGNYFSNVDNGAGHISGYVNGSVDVVYGNGSTSLYVDDSGDSIGREVTLYDGEISFEGAAPIYYSPTSTSTGGVTYLAIYGGSGGNTFYVENTSNLYSETYLDTGSGNDNIWIFATTGALYVYNPGSSVSVDVGLGYMGNVNGFVYVYGAGSTELTLDDSLDSTGRTAYAYDGEVTGLSPAPIIWSPTSSSTGGVTYLGIYGGSGGNVFYVEGTSSFYYYTFLDTGAGSDSVYVYDTTGTLDDYNPGGSDFTDVGVGNMSGINGSVDISGVGATYGTLDDSSDTTARTANLYNGEVTGLSQAPIKWTPTSSSTGGVVDLYVYGGSGGNTFNVENTSNFYYNTFLSTGTGSDTVNIYATTGALDNYNPGGQDYTHVGLGNMSGINGEVNVYGAGATSLYLQDNNNTAPSTSYMYNGEEFGLGGGTGTIYWTPTSSSTGGVTYLEVDGGSGGNTFNVEDTSNIFEDTWLLTGTGNDIVYVYATQGVLYDYNNGGNDFTDVGVGSVGSINGFIQVFGSGSTALLVDDSSDSTSRNATLTAFALTGLGNSGTIYYGNIGVTSLTIDGGSGSDTWNVDSTAAGTTTNLNSGSGSDNINVYATSAPLNLNNAGSTDVGIGVGDMSSINGVVDVFGAGSTTLILEDYNDNTPRTVTMNAGSVTGLSPATIRWTASPSSTGGVVYLLVEGGSAGSTYNVNNTSNFYYYTFLQTGGGNDIVNVRATTGGLYDYNGGGADATDVGLGSVANLSGFVEVYGSGTTAMTVDDHLDATARNATLTSSTLTGLGNAGTIYYSSGVTSLTDDGSKAGSTYNIQGTPVGTAVTVKGGTGNDIFNVGIANSLSGIQGALTINGGTGTNTLNVNDSSGGSGLSYALSSTVLTRSGAASITYAALAALKINAGGSDTLTILSPAPTVTTTFNGDTGSNKLVGPNTTNIWTVSGANTGVLGHVTFVNVGSLVGGAANDTFEFTTNTASLSGTVSGGGGITNELDYANSNAVTVTLTSANSGTASSIGGSFSGLNKVTGNLNAANTLTGPNLADNLWTITGLNEGTVNGVGFPTFTFVGMSHLVGGNKVDIFKFHSTGSKETTIAGGGAPANQGDWLDYSSFGANAVTVNLATGAATNVGGGVSGIQNVIGASSGINHLTGDAQGNILIGGSNATGNTLVGGDGNSLLIGGSGGGSIHGGAGQDILIAGTTTFSPATTAGKNSLMAILAELQSADSFADKVYDLIHGTNTGDPAPHGHDLNGANKLTWSGTVRALSGTSFTLQGDTSSSTAADWFFSNASSTVSDFNDDGVQDEHNNNAIGAF